MPSRPGAAFTADRAWRFATAVVIAATLAAWGRVPFGAFQYDDHDSVVTSPAAPTLSAFVSAWRGSLRPLLRSSYLLDRRLWGKGPAGLLAVNLTIHLGCVVCVLALARRRALAPLGAAAAALVFALQPADAEAVAYVTGRSSSLATLFLLLGLLAHDRAASAESAVMRRRALLLALLAFAAAVATKEIALVFPLLVAIWEGTRSASRRTPLRPLLAAYAAAGVCLAGILLSSSRLRALLEYSFAVSPPLRSLAANFAAAPGFLALWIRPGALSVEHPLSATTPQAVALGAALVALLVAGGLALSRRRPPVALALLWVPAALLPTNSLVWKLDPMSERSLYLAWVGPALALGAGVAALFRLATARHVPRAALLGAAALLALGAAVVCARRVAVWSDSRALWREATERAPASTRAWNNLGMAHWEHDDPAPARAAFRRVLALAPGDARARQNLFALALADFSPTASPQGGSR